MTQEPQPDKPDRTVKVYDRPAGADGPSPVARIVLIIVLIAVALAVAHFGFHWF